MGWKDKRIDDHLNWAFGGGEGGGRGGAGSMRLYIWWPSAMTDNSETIFSFVSSEKYYLDEVKST